MKKVLILGVNGFIGHHLSKRILETTDWEVFGMDMQTERLGDLVNHERMHFFEGDITINKEWVEYHVKKCDVILPLVAIATPATYVKQPLRVFELDFEANLPIVRSAVKYGKHLVFPSTSEVYGMCTDEQFDPEGQKAIRERVIKLIDEIALKYKDTVFRDNPPRITLSDRALAFIVSELAKYDLGRTALDAKGAAYLRM